MFKVLQKKLGISSAYKKTTTLGQLLFKRPPNKEKWGNSHVVYSVTCSEAPDQYIGKLKRTVATICKHEKSCELNLTGIQPKLEVTMESHFIAQPPDINFVSRYKNIGEREKSFPKENN